MMKLLTKVGSYNHVILVVSLTSMNELARVKTQQNFQLQAKHSTTELLGSQKGMIRSNTGGNMLYIVYQNTL